MVVLATNVALAGLPSASVSLYTASRATLPRIGSGVVVEVGQAIWMPVRARGYEPEGGVKRLSHSAARSVPAAPKLTEFSRVPSSRDRVIGSLGMEAEDEAVTGLPVELGSDENELVLFGIEDPPLAIPVPAAPLIRAGLPVGPPITSLRGAHVAVLVGVLVNVAVILDVSEA